MPEVVLRKLAFAAAALALGVVPGGAASASSAVRGYERTIEVASTPVAVRLHYGDAAPGSTALAGEGSVETKLPGDGQLVLRLPHTVGQVAALGEAQLAARYDLASRCEPLPQIAVAALVNLPALSAGSGSSALPGVRISVGKQLGSRFLDSLQVDTELRTAGPGLGRSSRTAIGASFRLPAATIGTLQLVSLRPASGSAGAPEALAELALARTLGPDANIRLGIGGAVTPGAASLRTQLGVELRF